MDFLLLRRGGGLNTPPPTPGTVSNNPSLLFSWWCTICAATIILARVLGRKVRSNKLFREDWVMLIALIPLFIRQALIHVVLIWGTNNIQTVGVHYTATQIAHRSMGSRLVIAARIFYALFIWVSKLTVSEFLKRITVNSWRRSYDHTLLAIRIFLCVSFAAVVIATLTECQPFDHFWQVVPDPGPQCRTGYSNLISMGACDILTDVLLVGFPIPIVLNSGQSWKRKLQLLSLFSLSLIMIGITATRVPEVISHNGRQQYRSVWASCEILASAAVSNAVILGSFVRGKGTKKNKFRSESVADSVERASVRRTNTLTRLRTTSEEDLFHSVGIRIPEHLRDGNDFSPRAAPLAQAAPPVPSIYPDVEKGRMLDAEQEVRPSDSSGSTFPPPTAQSVDPASASPVRSMSFFDVGGLLVDGAAPASSATRPAEAESEADKNYSHSTTLGRSSYPHKTITQDFAAATRFVPPRTPPSVHHPAGPRAFLHDIGGLFGSSSQNGPPSPTRPSYSASSTRPLLTGTVDRPGRSLQFQQSEDHELSRTLQRHRNNQAAEPFGSMAYTTNHDYPRHASPTNFSLPNGSSARPQFQQPWEPAGVMGLMLERQETQQSLQDAGGLLSSTDAGGSNPGEPRAVRNTEPVPPSTQRRDNHPFGMAALPPAQTNRREAYQVSDEEADGEEDDDYEDEEDALRRRLAERTMSLGQFLSTSPVPRTEPHPLLPPAPIPAASRSDGRGGRAEWEEIEIGDFGGLLR